VKLTYLGNSPFEICMFAGPGFNTLKSTVWSSGTVQHRSLPASLDRVDSLESLTWCAVHKAYFFGAMNLVPDEKLVHHLFILFPFHTIEINWDSFIFRPVFVSNSMGFPRAVIISINNNQRTIYPLHELPWHRVRGEVRITTSCCLTRTWIFFERNQLLQCSTILIQI
jgi:hypothetical protein